MMCDGVLLLQNEPGSQPSGVNLVLDLHPWKVLQEIVLQCLRFSTLLAYLGCLAVSLIEIYRGSDEHRSDVTAQ